MLWPSAGTQAGAGCTTTALAMAGRLSITGARVLVVDADFTDPRITDGAAFAKAVAKRLEKAGVALDVGAYRDAPPGLRIWVGGSVEPSDVKNLLAWLDWASQEEAAKL